MRLGFPPLAGILPGIFLFCLASGFISASRAGLAAEESIVAGHIVNVAGKVRIRKDGSKDTRDIRFARAGDVVMVGDIINTPSDGMIKLLLKDRSLMDLGPSSLFKVNSFKAAANNERQVDSTIVYGSLRAAVTQKIEGRGHFKVRSPSATMGVRGTEFLVKSSIPGDLKAMGSFLNGNSMSASNLKGTDSVVKSEITVLQGKVELAMPQAPKLPESGVPGAGGSAPAIQSTGSGTLMLTAGAQVTAQSGGQSPQAPAARVLESTQLQSAAVEVRAKDNTFTSSLEIKSASKEAERAEERAQAREAKARELAGERSDGGAKEGGATPEQTPNEVAQNTADPEASQEGPAKEGPKEGSGPVADNRSGQGPRNEAPSDRGPASGPGPGGSNPPTPASGNLGMSSFVQAAMSGVQMGGGISQTIRPADFVPAVPLSSTGIQTQALPNPNQLHNLIIQVRLQP